MAVTDERRRRALTTRDVAGRARVSLASVSAVEAGRRASLDVYARVATALGLDLALQVGARRGERIRAGQDLVHAAMGEVEAKLIDGHGYQVAIDHPYQHYQFAGRADLLAWSASRRALLHIENRTRFPNLQDSAGSFNAKCQYLAPVLARQMDLAPFRSQTHVIVALWSSEVIHAIRLRPRSFRVLCPDPHAAFLDWLAGDPPSGGFTRTLVLLDPFATGRQRVWVGLDAVTNGVRARVSGYAEAASRLGLRGRAPR
jgi:transcriptional regulator with XRE-family HTH domain